MSEPSDVSVGTDTAVAAFRRCWMRANLLCTGNCVERISGDRSAAYGATWEWLVDMLCEVRLGVVMLLCSDKARVWPGMRGAGACGSCSSDFQASTRYSLWFRNRRRYQQSASSKQSKRPPMTPPTIGPTNRVFFTARPAMGKVVGLAGSTIVAGAFKKVVVGGSGGTGSGPSVHIQYRLPFWVALPYRSETISAKGGVHIIGWTHRCNNNPVRNPNPLGHLLR